jgi:transposase
MSAQERLATRQARAERSR